jgi:hypothetical protein
MAEGAVAVEEAAGIICSLRAGDLAGWTPPWRTTPAPTSEAPTTKEHEDEKKAWPAVTRGKRSRSSRRRSPSGSGSAAKGRWARGSPASPLDYSGGGSVSGASTSGGEDGAFCSPPAVLRARAGPTAAAPASSSAKVRRRVRRHLPAFSAASLPSSPPFEFSSPGWLPACPLSVPSTGVTEVTKLPLLLKRVTTERAGNRMASR